MQTSLQFNERSPPSASSSNPASGQYYRSSRGFGYRKRGFNYRGRGGSYQRTSGSWHGRTAVKEEPLGDALAQSLLSRLEPSADSLLNRLSPGKEGPNESISSRPPAFDERTSADGEHSRAESEFETGNTDSVASSRNNSPQPSAMHDELAEQLIASALAQGKQLVEQHGLAERRSKSAASEAAVDDILAADDGEDAPLSPFSSNVPEDSSQLAHRANVDPAAVTTSSQSQSVDQTSVVEQARKLFIPVIIQNARLRNPDMDPEELEKKVVSLVTDEQCLAFVKFAQEARNQEKGRQSGGEKKELSVLDPAGLLLGGGALAEGEKRGSGKSESEKCGLQVDTGVSGAVAAEQVLGEAGAKRRREFTDGGESSSRSAKALRRATTDGSAPPTAIPLPPTVVRATSDDNVRVSSSQSSSRSVKEPPTAPKAMRGLAHSQSESSAGSSLPSPPGKTPHGERTKSGTTDITDHSIGIQSSEAKHASGASSPNSEPTTLLSVPLMTRASSTSSDMDIDDDSTPSPSKPPPSTQGSVHASSSSHPLPGVSIHLSTPVHIVQTQNSLVPDSTIKRSDNVQTTPAVAEILYSTPLDSSINGNASEARGNQNLPAAASTSSVVDDALRADSSIAQHPPQTLTNVLPTTESDPMSKDRPLLQPSQGENRGDSRLSVSLAHISSKDGGSVVLEDTKGDKGSASTGKLANNGFPEASIQDWGGQKDSATTSMSLEAVASARPTQKVQPQDSDKMDVDEKPVGDDASRVALHAPTESLSPTIDTSRNKSAAEPVGNCSISPTNLHMLGEVRATTTMRIAPPDPLSTSVDDNVKSDQRATPPGPTSLSSPYLYSAELGKPSPQVFTLRFDVGSESSAAASRWSRRQEQLDPSAPHVMFRLLCLHTADVEKAAVKNPTATPEEFASAMWNVQTKWPRRGQLLLEVNGETDTPGNWIPKQLGPEDGPVDLTPHIVPGINTIRIIQLAAQTDRIFIVYAGSPPEDEVKEFRNTAAWERLVREN